MPKATVDPAIAVINYFKSASIDSARTTLAIAKHTLNARVAFSEKARAAQANAKTRALGKKKKTAKPEPLEQGELVSA